MPAEFKLPETFPPNELAILGNTLLLLLFPGGVKAGNRVDVLLLLLLLKIPEISLLLSWSPNKLLV